MVKLAAEAARAGDRHSKSHRQAPLAMAVQARLFAFMACSIFFNNAARTHDLSGQAIDLALSGEGAGSCDSDVQGLSFDMTEIDILVIAHRHRAVIGVDGDAGRHSPGNAFPDMPVDLGMLDAFAHMP